MAATRHFKRVVKLTVGVILLALGVVGLFLPILQGILLIMAGLAILSTESRRVRAFNFRARSWLRKKFRAQPTVEGSSDE